jgi:hypothetical protein
MIGKRCNPVQAGIARLYHYEKFRPDWLPTTLREQKLRCSDPAKLNDPWDCKPWFDCRPMAEDPKKLETMLDSFRKTTGIELVNHPGRPGFDDWLRNSPEKLKDVLANLSRSFQLEISKRRIYCLTPDPRSTLMWSHYAENHRGICLEFHFGKLLFLNAWKVIYRSAYPVWVPQEMPAIADEAILTKSTDWEHEQEFRLVGSPNYAEGRPLKPEGDYLRLPPRALQSVIVGCEADLQAITNVVNEHAPGLPVKRSVRAPNRYELVIEDAANSASAG